MASVGNFQKVKGDFSDISPIVLGGATFSAQFDFHESDAQIVSLLDHAFTQGINTIDTSPYYGNSEIILGKALHKLGTPRDHYYLCTKAGRIGLNEFDYSSQWIEKSVSRSLERFNTHYLDLVYLHDVEFNDVDSVVEGLRALASLKKQGIVKRIGLSGYPVKFIYEMCLKAYEDPEVGKLDAVLSYCNLNVQNVRLSHYVAQLEKIVDHIFNASVLSMSLLRSKKALDFHPAPNSLKEAVHNAAQTLLKEDSVELANLALRFAFANWHRPTICGLANIQELDNALDQYHNKYTSKDKQLVEKFHRLLGDEHINETWPSGIHS